MALNSVTLTVTVPWIGHVGIKHFFMTPLVAAAKDNRSGIVHFFVTKETAWTAKVWIRPLLVRIAESLIDSYINCQNLLSPFFVLQSQKC